MTLARFYELCLDTTSNPDRPERLAEGNALGEFWAALLGLRLEPLAEGGLADVVGEEPWQRIALCPVPEPKTVKHRVHLDVYARSVADVEALGARVLAPAEETGLGWTVMADPEGGEFCVMLRDRLPPRLLHGIAVDCADAATLAAWWGEVYGRRVVPEDGWFTLEHTTPDPVLTLDFQDVPEPKTTKNRLHWDVEGAPGTTKALEAHGAVRLWEHPRWTTLADPEGNEFCVFEREGLALA
ncbi:VOC family protein [Nocardioides nanhaiensis]|uniref:VOC family protein n=1 Tax=Nocardioides nanhaiensis TaxID=1476871 RepID=A0ABP8X3J2_9ACTN